MDQWKAEASKGATGMKGRPSHVPPLMCKREAEASKGGRDVKGR